MQTLADLIREVLKGERLHAVQGNDWYGWWVGRIPDGRQIFAAFGGRAVYYSRWQQMTHPELANSNAGPPTLYLAVFDAAGSLQEVLSRPYPLTNDPKAKAQDGIGPEFDVAESEAYLAGEFGGFKRTTIRVRPFAIPEIGVQLNPLLSTQVGFLNDPTDYDAEEQESIREWIEEGAANCCTGTTTFLAETAKSLLPSAATPNPYKALASIVSLQEDEGLGIDELCG
jgi:hypothetical protein